jgi:hypothetical protein
LYSSKTDEVENVIVWATSDEEAEVQALGAMPAADENVYEAFVMDMQFINEACVLTK